MPAQKRSIREFFAPAQKDAPATASQTLTRRRGPKPPPVARTSSPAASEQLQHHDFTQEASSSPSPSPPPYPTSDTIRVNTPRSTIEDGPPSTSQSSTNSTATSKRVVSNGEAIVLNSDSETDSLPDLDWGEPSKASKPKPSPTAQEPKRHAKSNGLRKPPQQRKDGTSFNLFVQATQRNADAERKIAKAKAELQRPLTEEVSNPSYDISEDALAKAVHHDDDPDRAKRLYLAMQRTNALHTECVFHFFENKWDSHSIEDQPFPMNCLPDHRWTSNFQVQLARDEAFLSGFAQRVFQYQQLPEELASWMINQVCVSQNDILNEQYIRLLDAHHHYLQSLLDTARLDSMFKYLGADTSYLNLPQQAAPSFEPHPATIRRLPASLKSVCRLLQAAAPRLRTKASTHALYILLHLCMDNSVNSDIDTLHAVQVAIEAVMCHITNNEKLSSALNEIVPALLARIQHPILQRNLVCGLPASSPMAAYFQRHLALAFLLHPTLLDTPLDSPKVIDLIHAYLRDSPDFRITREIDHRSLAARVTLLDIAIGPGPSAVPYQPLASPTASQDGSSPTAAPGLLSPEEKAFNKEVDALVQQIKLFSDSIVETGSMTDLSRLEARGCGERLYHRLEHAVRIGGMKLENPFTSDEDVWQSKNVLSKWLGRNKNASMTPAMMPAMSDATNSNYVEEVIDGAIET